MKTIKLADNYSFSLERYDSRIRLIVSDDLSEIVCRKETFRNLYKFIEGEDNHIFKGRLQLFKQDNLVTILVKGKVMGTISMGALKKGIDELSKV